MICDTEVKLFLSELFLEYKRKKISGTVINKERFSCVYVSMGMYRKCTKLQKSAENIFFQ